MLVIEVVVVGAMGTIVLQIVCQEDCQAHQIIVGDGQADAHNVFHPNATIASGE